ncbi:MAG: hypothetical protein ACNS62_01740 [Candidatus Cyclobacteriaceae bacterium M3_2C_046]
MKAKLVPLYFDPGKDDNFEKHLDICQNLLRDDAEFLKPVAVGQPLPEADAAIFPQMLGEAYGLVPQLQAISIPIMVITSAFGTVNMWDWELVNYLKLNGISTICPPSLEDTKMVCRALVVRRQLAASKFIVYQDDPAGPTGQQSDIFKRFYWLEKEAPKKMFEKYGITIEQRSFRDLAARAREISDKAAEEVASKWNSRHKSIQGRPLMSAVKLYMEIKKEYEADQQILAMGLNCLNESKSCDTTPCLAWNLLYQEKNLVWGCEADTMVMLTEILADKVLQAPFFMTNLYPFIMGQAALAHERIPYFPQVDEPENHILAAHCGYFGLLPETFADNWSLKKRVLAMVNENATMIDATLPTGPITLMKFQPYLEKISLSEAALTGYVQFENSDCLNGGIIKVKDGQQFVDKVASHHYVLLSGHKKAALNMISNIFDYELEVI